MLTFIKEFIQTTVILSMLAFPASANNNNIVRVTEDNTAIFYSEISTKSVDRLKQLYSATKFDTLIINSPGGDFDAGKDLGEFINHKDIYVYVTNQCNSACTFAFFGAKVDRRDISARAGLGLHNVSISTTIHNTEETYVSVAQMIKYTNDIADKVGYLFSLYAANGVPPTTLLNVSKVRGNKVIMVTRDELVQWGSIKE